MRPASPQPETFAVLPGFKVSIKDWFDRALKVRPS